MNKFSPSVVPADDPVPGRDETDFDFGDLVTLTIIDVFETDAEGMLLSYCPTFDNRSVRRTPEMAERLRKGAGRLREGLDAAARSPAGRGVSEVGKMSLRAAMVVGNAVRDRVQHGKGGREQSACRECDEPREGRLNELLESQIATDETELDNVIDASKGVALEEDPTTPFSDR